MFQPRTSLHVHRGGFELPFTSTEEDSTHGSVEDTKLSTNKQHSLSFTSTEETRNCGYRYTHELTHTHRNLRIHTRTSLHVHRGDTQLREHTHTHTNTGYICIYLHIFIYTYIYMGKRVFITNVKGTFLGMSESEEASKRR